MQEECGVAVGVCVEVIEPFASGSFPPRQLRAGLQGTVKKIDDSGYALVDFKGIGALQLVSNCNFAKLRDQTNVKLDVKEESAADTISQSLKVCLNGEPIDVDLRSTRSVPQVRVCLAKFLEVDTWKVQLVVGNTIIRNDDPFSKLGSNGGEITLVLQFNPPWCDKYTHNGKPVRKIVMRSCHHKPNSKMVDGDSDHDESHEEIYYADEDQTVWKESHEGHGQYQNYPIARPLAKELKFIERTVKQHTHFFGRHGKIQTEEIIAFAPEDPDMPPRHVPATRTG